MTNRFRVWDTEGKCWDNGFLISSKGTLFYTYSAEDHMCLKKEPQQDRYVIVWSTGRKDKNKVEIYTGDIVRQDFTYTKGWNGEEEDAQKGSHTGEVIVLPSMGACIKTPIVSREGFPTYKNKDGYKSLCARRCAVLGNKFQHPELLEEK